MARGDNSGSASMPTYRAKGGLLYLGASGLSTVGSAVGALESTYVATVSSPTAGGLRTAVMLIGLLVASTITVPMVPGLATRWGTSRLYRLTMVATVIIWALGGAAILAGTPAYSTMLVITPLIGITLGLTTVLSPLFARAYLGASTMAGAYARLSVVTGLSWGVGSLLGGRVFDHVPSGYGILARGILAVPLVVVLAFIPPAGGEIRSRTRHGGGLRAVAKEVVTPGSLRIVIALSAAVAVFALPYLSLIVPIAAALRQTPLASGAGLIMAGTAAGEMMSPILVGRLQARFASLPAAIAAAVGCAGCLLVFAATSAVLSDRSELLVWTGIGVAFGALRYTVKSLELDAAVSSGRDHTEAIAAVSFAKSLTAPLGLLIWSALMWAFSVEVALVVAGAGLMFSCFVIWRWQGVQQAPTVSISG